MKRKRRMSDAQRRAMFASMYARDRKRRQVIGAGVAVVAGATILGAAAHRSRRAPWGNNAQLKFHFERAAMTAKIRKAFRPRKLTTIQNIKSRAEDVMRRLRRIKHSSFNNYATVQTQPPAPVHERKLTKFIKRSYGRRKH